MSGIYGGVDYLGIICCVQGYFFIKLSSDDC